MRSDFAIMSNDVLQIFAMSSDDYTTFLSTLTPAAQDVVRAIFQAGTLDSEDVYYAIVTDDFESWLFADFADEPFLAGGFGLRLHVVLVIIICHGFDIAHDAAFGYGAEEHAMAAEITVAFHLQRHKGVDIF